MDVVIFQVKRGKEWEQIQEIKKRVYEEGGLLGVVFFSLGVYLGFVENDS